MSFKIFFSQTQQPIEIRRITVSSPPPTWSQFKQTLEQLFPTNFNPNMLIQYEDDERELICIHSQVEWTEALSVLQSLKIKKIFISNSDQTKMTTPEPILPHQDSHDQFPESPTLSSSSSSSQEITNNRLTDLSLTSRESFQRFAESIPQLLEAIFHGKGINFELPDWFKVAVERAKKEGREVNLEKHYHEFVTRGLHFLNQDIYQNGKKAFEKLLALKENHPEIMKNLVAQAEVIKTDARTAFTHLEQSIQLSICQFSNAIESDPDFQTLKAKPEFGSFVEYLKKKISVSTAMTNTIPERVQDSELPEYPPRLEEVSPQLPEDQQKIDAQLETLKSMGFLNVDVNKVLLEDSKGNLDQVISTLLDRPNL